MFFSLVCLVYGQTSSSLFMSLFSQINSKAISTAMHEERTLKIHSAHSFGELKQIQTLYNDIKK